LLALAGGTLVATTVLNGNNEIVSSGGVASGTIVSSGGAVRVALGGRTSGMNLKGGGVATVSGTTTGTTIAKGGCLIAIQDASPIFSLETVHCRKHGCLRGRHGFAA
jgi:autotransporter passenger strand-loop-strand repeat protein